MTDTTELNKKESTITAYILKGGSTASATDRDAGFCSGGDEDDLEIEDDIHSPTDVSEDSVEVKVTPISSRNKNKRKCAEPRKVPNDEIVPSGPLKKRIRFEMKQEETATERKKSFFEAMKKETVIVKQETNYFTETKLERNFDPTKQNHNDFYQLKHQERILQSPNSDIKHERSSTGRSSPFRPWSLPTRPIPNEPSSPPANFHPVYGYQPIPVVQQDEPLSLVKTKPESPRHYSPQQKRKNHHHHQQDLTTNQVPDAMVIRPKEFSKLPIKIEPPRVPPHPAVRPPTAQEIEELTRPPKVSPGFTVESLLSAKASTSSSQHAPSTSSMKGEKADSKKEHKDQKEQRNYKNMTRERRIEANARERTRVHTISAAFDTLRRAIPAYSHNQKLSKLSVLRIACSYILTLSRVAGSDYSADQSEPSLAECVDLVSRTIQTEGKLRKKKDE